MSTENKETNNKPTKVVDKKTINWDKEKKKTEIKMKDKKKTDKVYSGKKTFYMFNIVFLFTCVFLLVSSFWYEYVNFYVEIGVCSILLLIGLFFRKYVRKISLAFALVFFISFFVWNYNYMFVFFICVILGVLALHFLEPELNIPQWVYSLIPVLILAHIIWFNVLPFGFNGSWELDVGSKGDMDVGSDLYIIDNNKVLSEPWSFGDKTWREFKKDGSFQIGFNTPVYLENKTVEISMEYEATSPIYINGELFYDPAWGSSVELMNEGEVFVYGADVFNLTKDYENASVNLFLNVTNSSSIDAYVLDKYFVDLESFAYEMEVVNESLFTKLDEVEIGSLIDLNNTNSSKNETLNKDFIEVTGMDGFLLDRGFNSTEDFMLSELNSGLYEKPQLRFNYSNIEEFMNAKYPNGVAMKDFTGLYAELEADMNSRYVNYDDIYLVYPDFNNSIHNTNTTFRGPIKFYGIFSKNINISFNKTDLNWYNGKDNIRLIIKTFDGNIVSNVSIIDDGIEDNSKRIKSQYFNHNIEINKSGKYIISFEYDNLNHYMDFTINNLKINTNKFVTINRFLPLTPTTLYFENGKEIEYRYWTTGFNQFITYDDNNSLELTSLDKSKDIKDDISQYYKIKFEKGNLWINTDTNFGLWENGWFNPYQSDKIITFNKKTNYIQNNIIKIQLNNLTISSHENNKIFNINININKNE